MRTLRIPTQSTDRKMFFAGLAVPGTIALATWKVALVFVAPSIFLVANVVFTLGVAVAKLLAVRAYRATRALPQGTQDPMELERSAFRRIGILLIVLAAAYTASFLPVFDDLQSDEPYHPVIAVLIAAVAFAEFGISIGGAVVARRNKELMVEAVRLINMAAGVVLIVLTQYALLSFASTESDWSTPGRLGGVIFGPAVALIGAYMVLRPSFRRLLGGGSRSGTAGA